MINRNFLICWIPVFVVVFALNGVFHGLVAATYFDEHLSMLRPAIKNMSDTNPVWVGLLDLILVFGMTYFILNRRDQKISLSHAAFIGGLINLISSGAWNFANAAMFENWPLALTGVDITWHVTLGAVGGILIAILNNRFGKG